MRLPLTDIILIEGWNEYVKVHISGKTIVTLAALRDLEDLLPEDRFIRVHRSFIVSLAGIRSWNTSSIEMNGGKQVPVGRVYKEGFLTAIGRLRDMRL
jgi:DNA-binding LytR/AlgR family response regulator